MIMAILGVFDEILSFYLLPKIPLSDPETSQELPRFWILKQLPSMFIYSILGMILTFIKGALVTWMVSCYCLGKDAEIGQSFQFALRRFGSLAGAAILYILGVTFLFITIFGIPFSIYFLVSWGFAVQTCTLEHLGPKKSLKRSSWLVEDHWWRIVGIMLVFLLISAPIYIGFHFVPFVGKYIGAVLAGPLFVIAGILLYFNLRVRKEGYNLEKLSEELGFKPITPSL